MTKVRYLVFLFLVVLSLPVYGTILMRNTFEKYEGLTPQECGWVDTTGDSGLVLLDKESADSFQTQGHGEWSLRIYDPNDTSYASAYKTFTNSASEYMTEFYLWIYHTQAHIDSFPLCVLWNVPSGMGISHRTDIALVLDTVITPPDDQIFTIRVQDANGFHTACYLDTSCYDTWHKIQIYRKPPATPLPAKVVLYFDGDSIGTYNPMNSGYVTNKISFGTTQTDSLSDGEVFYDDVIVTTPPVGEHPRLLFSASDTTLLRERKDDTTSTISETYASMWGHIKYWASRWMVEDTIWWDTHYIMYPFPQPEGHPDSLKQSRWMRYSEEIEMRLNLLSFHNFLEPDSAGYRERADSILISLCNDWEQWTDPDYRAFRAENLYSFFDAARLMWGITIAYDILFNTLSNYEKMTVQNALISLGLTQTYLCALYTEGSLNPWKYPNSAVWRMSALGTGVLATDSCSLEAYLDTARARMQELINTEEVCDSAGGWSEGITYAQFALPHLLAFMQADSVLADSLEDKNFLKNHARWRLYSMLRVDTSFTPDSVWEYSELNFCDYHQNYMRKTSAIYRLASMYQDGYAQWYIDKREDLTMLFFPYLWFDDTLSPNDPDSLAKAYHCKEIDWGIVRSGWGIDDCIFAMKGDSLKSHTHYDRNSFIFGKDATWFIEDWGYSHNDTTRFAETHNVLIVNGEMLTKGAEKGEITKCYSSSDYGYLCGEAGTCYDELDKWNREAIVLYKGGYFVIKDWVKPYADVVDTLRWQVHSYIVEADTDSLSLSPFNPKYAIISKSNKHLKMQIFRPTTVSLDTVTPFPDNRVSYKRIYTEIIDALGVDSLTFLTSFLPYDDGDSCPGVSEIDGGTMRGVFIDTDSTDNVILFSKRGNVVKGLSYVVDIDSGVTVFNVLADLYVSEVGQTEYAVVDENLDTGTRADTSLTPTSEGTASLDISGTGKHRLTVFIPGKIESGSDDATASNSTRRFIYEDSLNRFHLLYEDNNQIMHGERFSNIDGWVEGYRIGDGKYPAAASFADTTGDVILGGVWINDGVIFFSRYSYAYGWSESCSLITNLVVGVNIHYAPPSLGIDDSGIGHLTWELYTEPTHYPGYITYKLHYSTFNAGLDTPSIIEDDTLDSASEYVSEWIQGLELECASIALYNDTMSVITWSRPIGAGKDTIYCKQETAGGWPASPEVISSSSDTSNHPFCDIESSTIHIVWEEEGIIKHRQRQIVGDWGSIETVSNTSLTSRSPQMLGGDLCAFTEVPLFPPGNYSHIVYRKRSAFGWGASVVIDSTNSLSEYPQSYIETTAFGRNLHTVWTEGNNSPYEVKYKKVSQP